MPIYEYDCPTCGRFEQIQKVSEKPLKACPICADKGKKNTVERVVSTAAFHLKGSGWYKTDYASSKASSGSDASKVSASGSKPAKDTSDSGSATSADSTPTAKDTGGAAKSDTTSGGGSTKGGCGSGACGCH